MNRFQYDNIDPDVTPKKRESVLKQKIGINFNMSAKRRAEKQARHRANASMRLEISRANVR